MLEPDCTVGLTLSGALTPAGLGMSCLIPLIRAGFVDWIVSTGANLYHDTHYALDLPAPPEPAQPRRLRAPRERHHPDLRHRLRLQDAARHRRLLPRADPRRAVRPADGHGRVPPRGRPLPPRPGRGAGPAGQQPAGRGLRGGRADLHVEPRRQLDRHEPGRAEPARRPAPDRHPPRRQRDGRDRLPGQARRRQVGRPDPRRRAARRTSSSRPSRRSRKSSAWPRAGTTTSSRSPTPAPTPAASPAPRPARR